MKDPLYPKVTMTKTILLSGANGFVAAHILNVLLSAGYNVLGAVRSPAAADRVKISHAKFVARSSHSRLRLLLKPFRFGDKLSFTIVPDIEVPGAFDEAVKDVDGVIHSASPFHYPVDDNERDLFHPAVNGTLRMLEAVHASSNKRIQRVVITASFASVVDITKGYNPGKVYTEADWNPMTWEEAKNADGSAAYCASKSFAEKAAYDFVEKNKPSFSIATLCPPMIYGPNAHYVDSLDKLNTSSSQIWNYINGSQTSIPRTGFPAFADVRNIAVAHQLVLEKPEAANRRFIITSGPFMNQQFCDIIRAKFPELRDKVPVGQPNEPFPEHYRVSNDRATKELGIKWIPFEVTVKDSVESLLAIEKKLSESK